MRRQNTNGQYELWRTTPTKPIRIGVVALLPPIRPRPKAAARAANGVSAAHIEDDRAHVHGVGQYYSYGLVLIAAAADSECPLRVAHQPHPTNGWLLVELGQCHGSFYLHRETDDLPVEQLGHHFSGRHHRHRCRKPDHQRKKTAGYRTRGPCFPRGGIRFRYRRYGRAHRYARATA